MDTKFIAEVCSNHNGSLNRCLKFIKTAKEIGCYGVKFQLFKTEKLFANEILKKSPIHRKRKKWELPEKFIKRISVECKKRKIKFGCTPFYLESLPLLKKYVDFIKISSYEILWRDLLIECAKLRKPIIFSTGMANIKEIRNAKKILKYNGAKDITVLHCVSEYPANLDKINLNYFSYLKKNISTKVGWSDHTRDKLLLNYLISKFNLDAVEFHLDLDKKGFEYGDGHCWLPEEIENVIKFYSKVKNKNSKKNLKKISLIEKKERFWRADPIDGLRPMKIIRNKF